jgi:hypothetical protein
MIESTPQTTFPPEEKLTFISEAIIAFGDKKTFKGWEGEISNAVRHLIRLVYDMLQFPPAGKSMDELRVAYEALIQTATSESVPNAYMTMARVYVSLADFKQPTPNSNGRARRHEFDTHRWR